MKILLIQIIIFFTINVCRAEEPQKFDQKYLKYPEVNEARPDWWYDVWNGDGMIAVIDIMPRAEYKWIEFMVLDSQESNERFKFTNIQCKIIKTLHISDIFKNNNFNFSNNNDSVDLYIENRFKIKSGTWVPLIEMTENKCLVFIERIGISAPGKYHIKWYMNSDFENQIASIIEARNKLNK